MARSQQSTQLQTQWIVLRSWVNICWNLNHMSEKPPYLDLISKAQTTKILLVEPKSHEREDASRGSQNLGPRLWPSSGWMKLLQILGCVGWPWRVFWCFMRWIFKPCYPCFNPSKNPGFNEVFISWTGLKDGRLGGTQPKDRGQGRCWRRSPRSEDLLGRLPSSQYRNRKLRHW